MKPPRRQKYGGKLQEPSLAWYRCQICGAQVKGRPGLHSIETGHHQYETIPEPTQEVSK